MTCFDLSRLLLYMQGRNVVVKLAMEGQKEKPQQTQVSTPQTAPIVSQLQPGYSINPNIAPYPRAQLQGVGGGGSSIGLSGYPSSLTSAYTSQPSYASLGGTQYGSVGAGGGQYGSSPYPQYGGGGGGYGGGGGSQGVQSGLHTSNVLPGYYGAPP